MATTTTYASFLVRLWREPGSEESDRGWRGEVEHIQSRERQAFAGLDELAGLLRRQAEEERT